MAGGGSTRRCTLLYARAAPTRHAHPPRPPAAAPPPAPAPRLRTHAHTGSGPSIQTLSRRGTPTLHPPCEPALHWLQRCIPTRPRVCISGCHLKLLDLAAAGAAAAAAGQRRRVLRALASSHLTSLQRCAGVLPPADSGAARAAAGLVGSETCGTAGQAAGLVAQLRCPCPALPPLFRCPPPPPLPAPLPAGSGQPTPTSRCATKCTEQAAERRGRASEALRSAASARLSWHPPPSSPCPPMPPPPLSNNTLHPLGSAHALLSRHHPPCTSQTHASAASAPCMPTAETMSTHSIAALVLTPGASTPTPIPQHTYQTNRRNCLHSRTPVATPCAYRCSSCTPNLQAPCSACLHCILCVLCRPRPCLFLVWLRPPAARFFPCDAPPCRPLILCLRPHMHASRQCKLGRPVVSLQGGETGQRRDSWWWGAGGQEGAGGREAQGGESTGIGRQASRQEGEATSSSAGVSAELETRQKYGGLKGGGSRLRPAGLKGITFNAARQWH